MGKYVYLNKEIDKEILINWYINSTDEDTIWTEKHIDELLEDFVLIPKSSLKSIEEKTINDIKKHSVKHGRWIHDRRTQWKCSNCGNFLDFDGLNCGSGFAFFCPNCGTDMREPIE